ncbi:MAG: HAD-IIB family hydrolase [Gammaproteobacteria bacterium]|nr:HAD-IIB family hydrolase [Gammaproteobacteria bacterium]
MRAITAMSNDIRRCIRGVLTDIDDTLTTDGVLTAEAYSALARIKHAGLLMIPITGRPAGWCDHIARMWPVDAVVGENGAFYFRYDGEHKRMLRRFVYSDAQRKEQRERLIELGYRILAEVPGAALASDQHYRESDLAIDYCEDVPRLAPAEVARIVELFESHGATAKISSIHVNGWFGDFDKLSMTRILMQECFDTDIDRCRGSFVFVGDSPNDCPLFRHFSNSVGVANIGEFSASLEFAPAYVTKGSSGAGFTEVADLLLRAR